MQPELIKIDRPFVNNIETRSLRSTLLPGIVTLAQGQNIKVMADGVDNPTQVEALLAGGVIWGQGTPLGEPDSIEALIKTTQSIKENPIGTRSSDSSTDTGDS